VRGNARKRRSAAPISPATRTASPSTRRSRRSPPASASAPPAGTARGFGEAEFRTIAQQIIEVVGRLAETGEDGNGTVEAGVKAGVAALCQGFPIYPGL
jgi:glycine hydroxymethyltransferase